MNSIPVNLAAALARTVAATQSGRGQQVVRTQVLAAVQHALNQGQPALPLPGAVSPQPGTLLSPGGATTPPPGWAALAQAALAHAVTTWTQGGAAQVTGVSGQPAPIPAAPAPASTSSALAAAATPTAAPQAVPAGSPGQLALGLFAADHAAIDDDAARLLAQGVNPRAVTRLVAQRRANADEANIETLTRIAASQHNNSMAIIRNTQI